MYRLIENEFKEWKNNNDRKPLIIIGARQVGKTYSCRKFASECYKDILEINFQENVNAREFFSVPHSINDILMYLEINNSDKQLNEDTLLFFDEIQLVPELISSLKFFSGKCKSDIVCTGSMLGVKINGISSFPVGYVELKNMYPFSFTEFLSAAGIKQDYLDTAISKLRSYEEVPLPIHDRFNELFTHYIVCGGMPEAVAAYTESGLSAAVAVNRRLVNDFEMDIAHYADSKTKIKALECFRSLPLQLAKDNKKFQYKLVKEGYNARYYDESLSWLANSGLIYLTHRLKNISMPLELGVELAVFKAYLFNTGLLAAMFSDATISEIINDTLGVYKGVFFENIAAQMLTFCKRKYYYYEPNSSAEIDFVIEYNGKPAPIEVKGGLHTRSVSFNNFIKNHECRDAFRFSRKNVGISEDGVTRYLPLYSLEWIL